MIEKFCKIDIEDIDYTAIECGECHSEIRATKVESFPNACPVCNARYSDFTRSAITTVLKEIETMKKQSSRTKVFIIARESDER